MPRLNYGTLLENLVVLEASRLCLGRTEGEQCLAFASAFAMPPLTQTWSGGNDATYCARFNETALTQLSQQAHQTGTLAEFISLCRANTPALPVCPYRPLQTDGPLTGGPNGALLAAMLTAARKRRIHMWLNDDGGRYGEVHPATPSTQSETPLTLAHAGALVNEDVTGAGTVTPTFELFPGTIDELVDWLGTSPVQEAPIRVGFLDPDNYTGAGAAVSRAQHSQWLTALATGCSRVLSIMFFSIQLHSDISNRLTSFHQDSVEAYPKSLVFRSTNRVPIGNSFVGVKIRWPSETIEAVVSELREAVSGAWDGWGGLPGVVRVYVDGQFA